MPAEAVDRESRSVVTSAPTVTERRVDFIKRAFRSSDVLRPAQPSSSRRPLTGDGDCFRKLSGNRATI
jgi:hypothetical protein